MAEVALPGRATAMRAAAARRRFGHRVTANMAAAMKRATMPSRMHMKTMKAPAWRLRERRRARVIWFAVWRERAGAEERASE